MEFALLNPTSELNMCLLIMNHNGFDQLFEAQDRE